MDLRPSNCRFRLEDEGKPYPRSSCAACGKTITTGLGRLCSQTSVVDGRKSTLGMALEAITSEGYDVTITCKPTIDGTPGNLTLPMAIVRKIADADEVTGNSIQK